MIYNVYYLSEKVSRPSSLNFSTFWPAGGLFYTRHLYLPTRRVRLATVLRRIFIVRLCPVQNAPKGIAHLPNFYTPATSATASKGSKKDVLVPSVEGSPSSPACSLDPLAIQ